ncbi:hypothetical protein M422DRAFT_256989 [Sphaerobolus stellatus SS14]|uniref:Beta-trefoil n=1 Tax=Sphaerobolus stellatus (strain SS14) TaxID=990650 RepID=A0A0C9UAJ4_SPHS4|nr:hypothetical protein M422DRAFT_256989 [Sphaerobolus stellatus SS14]
MRIINHAYPPPPPPPLIIDDLHSDHDDMSQRSRLDDDHPQHRQGAPTLANLNHIMNAMNAIPNTAQNTHDPARSPYATNSPATVSNHERPPPDPTNIRSISAPHQDWHRNGEHIRETQASSSKRKLDEAADESQNKVRKTVREHLVMDYARVMTMTTVICLHAAVAQKSYGSEKRFLCPPPVVRIETPYLELKSQNLTMSIVSESGERGPEQRSSLDNNMVASFKYLHVAGTAKSKSFQLALDIAEPMSASDDGVPGRVWASFDSAPVTIISKPSKKTAKTRNISSCILAGGPVSLFNRINSQTVRTKYMTIEHAQLCASNLSWSAFNVNVTRRHADPGPPPAGPQPVTYGSEIQLVDSLTGITTSPLIIRKVDKGKVSAEDGGPVSQMQKIALQRINPDGSRSYLSAASPVPGASIPGAPTPGSAGQPSSHPLIFGSPRVRDEVRDGVRVVTDEVDDYLCWTIVGISKFQYTFFDGSGQNSPVPRVPITPFPTLFTAPAYRPAPHTIELTVSNFFYQHPETLAHTPLEVWLGNLGPLRQRIFQATPPGPLTSVSPYALPAGGPIVGEATNVNVGGPPAPGEAGSSGVGDTPQTIVAPPRFVPSGPLHTIIIVDLPPLNDIVKTLQEGMPHIGDGMMRRNTGRRDRGDSISNSEGGDDGMPPPENGAHGAGPMPGQALPLLFIRGSDGIGYHSGRSIACDPIYPPPPPPPGSTDADGRGSEGWMGGNGGWSLRVL